MKLNLNANCSTYNSQKSKISKMQQKSNHLSVLPTCACIIISDYKKNIIITQKIDMYSTNINLHKDQFTLFIFIYIYTSV